MKTKFLQVFCFSIIFSQLFSPKTANSQTELGWFQLQSGTTIALNSVYFINADTGWVSGSSGIIRKTTDGGLIWIPQNSLTTFTLNSIRFINSMTGWAVGAGGTIKYTTNGGTNWLTRSSGTVYPFYSLQYINQSTGWAAGYGGRVQKTTNGGTNWIIQTTPVFTDLYDVYFQSPINGWVVGYVGTIIRTTDGGDNWSNLSIGNTVFNGVWFTSPLTGWICGNGGIIRRTSNGGDSWVNLTSSTTANLRAIYFVPGAATRGWVGGSSGVIRYSTNLGTNWISQVSNTTNQIEEFCFLNQTTGWAVGAGGTILKTYTGGVITGINSSQNAPSEFELKQNYPNPFNPETKIEFTIPLNIKNSKLKVKLAVYDILGKEIAVLLDKELKSGSYNAGWNASNHTSGVYFYRLSTEGYSETKTMVLIK